MRWRKEEVRWHHRRKDLRANFKMHCIPMAMLDTKIPSYDDFLNERRKLMAQKIKAWFEAL